jgi:ribosomal protein S15P/S13E
MVSRERREAKEGFGMPLSKEGKQAITERFGKDRRTPGRPHVQVAMLTQRINELSEHLRSTRRTTTAAAAC